MAQEAQQMFVARSKYRDLKQHNEVLSRNMDRLCMANMGLIDLLDAAQKRVEELESTLAATETAQHGQAEAR